MGHSPGSLNKNKQKMLRRPNKLWRILALHCSPDGQSDEKAMTREAHYISEVHVPGRTGKNCQAYDCDGHKEDGQAYDPQWALRLMWIMRSMKPRWISMMKETSRPSSTRPNFWGRSAPVPTGCKREHKDGTTSLGTTIVSFLPNGCLDTTR